MDQQNTKHIIVLLVAVMGWGCEETIQLDVDQAPPQYTIEGLITNEFTDHHVKITTSTDFYSEAVPPTVAGATVTVRDDAGRTYPFEESETTPGLYTARFEGKVGQTYTMEATMPDGKVFTAADQMYPVTSVDSLTWEVDREEFADPEDRGFFYNVKIYAREPQSTIDYYLFKFYRNDTLQTLDSQTGLFYSDDTLLQGYIYGLEAPIFFRKGDVATFAMYRISRPAYLFYGDLSNSLDGDGGMLAPSPTDPRTNIVSEQLPGLGFFQVSAVTRESIVVGE